MKSKWKTKQIRKRTKGVNTSCDLISAPAIEGSKFFRHTLIALQLYRDPTDACKPLLRVWSERLNSNTSCDWNIDKVISKIIKFYCLQHRKMCVVYEL